MNQEKRNALLSLIFYVLVTIAIVLINISGKFKSGPCTPNLDVMSFFLIGPISLILLMINGIQIFWMKKQTKYSFFIHLAALIIWITILSVGSFIS
jgi:hypothetical protein